MTDRWRKATGWQTMSADRYFRESCEFFAFFPPSRRTVAFILLDRTGAINRFEDLGHAQAEGITAVALEPNLNAGRQRSDPFPGVRIGSWQGKPRWIEKSRRGQNSQDFPRAN